MKFLSIFLAIFFCLIITEIFGQSFESIEFQKAKIIAKDKFGSLKLKERKSSTHSVRIAVVINNQLPDNIHTTEADIRFSQLQDKTICSASSFDTTISKTVFIISVEDKSVFYGCGEQFSHFVLNGHRFPIITEEQGIGRGDKPLSNITKLLGVAGSEVTTYYPVPFAVCKDYSISLYGASAYTPAVFDFSESGKVKIEVYSRSAAVCVERGSSLRALVEANPYYQKEKQKPLPDWAYGTILGLQGGEEKVNRIVDSCLQLGNPVTAVWIQDWCGRRKTRLGSQLKWEWKTDTTLYPNIGQWILDLNKKGIKVLGYVNPFLSIGTAMFEEAKQKNFLIKNKKGEVHIIPTGGFDAALVNVLDPFAAKWLQNIVQQNMIQIGLNGWMADFGEWCPWFVKDSVSNSNNIIFPARNLYTTKWAELNKEAVEASGINDLIYFMRSGSAYSANAAPVFWMGDQTVNWGENDGLKSTLKALNSAAMSGIPFLHSDIGGYTTVDNAFLKVKRDRELFFRWAELNVFQPFYRTHEGLRPSSNHQFYSDDSTLHFFATMSKLHFRLKEYFQQYQNHNSLACLHPLLLDFPDDSNCVNITDQFMCGDELMVAPIVTQHALNRSVYFPSGEWKHLFTKQIYHGGRKEIIEAPYGVIPVFIQTNSKWLGYFDELVK